MVVKIEISKLFQPIKTCILNYIRLKFKVQSQSNNRNVNFNSLNIVLIATINYHLYKIWMKKSKNDPYIE